MKFNRLYKIIMEQIKPINKPFKFNAEIMEKIGSFEKGIEIYKGKLNKNEEIEKYAHTFLPNAFLMWYDALCLLIAVQNGQVIGFGRIGEYFDKHYKSKFGIQWWQDAAEGEDEEENLILLDGSTWNVPEDWLKPDGKFVKQIFIKNNNLKLNPSTGRYDADGDVFVHADLISNGTLLVPLGQVKGNFYNYPCYYEQSNQFKLTDKVFTHSYDSTTTAPLSTLKDCPTKVGGHFVLIDGYFTNLQGAPKEVGGNFFIDYCDELTSLIGSPQKVGGTYTVSHSYHIISLDGLTPNIGGGLDLFWDYRLESLKGCPRTLNGDFNIAKTGINSLTYAPIRVTGKVIMNQIQVPLEQRKNYKKMLKK